MKIELNRSSQLLENNEKITLVTRSLDAFRWLISRPLFSAFLWSINVVFEVISHSKVITDLSPEAFYLASTSTTNCTTRVCFLSWFSCIFDDQLRKKSQICYFNTMAFSAFNPLNWNHMGNILTNIPIPSRCLLSHLSLLIG